jgi:hypothetical protein
MLVTVDLPSDLLLRIPGNRQRFIRTALENELSGDLKRAKSLFARLGGSAKSAKKAAASRLNGKKGGRPPKNI